MWPTVCRKMERKASVRKTIIGGIMEKLKLSDLNLLAFGNTIQMSGAMYSGEGKTYLCFFPEDKNDLPVHFLEMEHEEWKAFLRQTDIMETEILQKAKDGTLVKAMARKSQRNIDQSVSWKVWKRDSYRCRYCGNGDTPLTVDHLVLWEEMGPSIESNLLSACKKCNKVRGNLKYDAWLQHPHYLQVSKRLDQATRDANTAILATLDNVPRLVHARSR